MNAADSPFMPTHCRPDVALRDPCRALRERWTHEDTLVNDRASRLMLSDVMCLLALLGSSHN